MQAELVRLAPSRLLPAGAMPPLRRDRPGRRRKARTGELQQLPRWWQPAASADAVGLPLLQRGPPEQRQKARRGGPQELRQRLAAASRRVTPRRPAERRRARSWPGEVLRSLMAAAAAVVAGRDQPQQLQVGDRPCRGPAARRRDAPALLRRLPPRPRRPRGGSARSARPSAAAADPRPGPAPSPRRARRRRPSWAAPARS
mmetsp:Transcript_107811/g.271135  ORF Transcript_107811/g.271135 Transcript_107811/m.271135 type:complete len:201 (-) Transcript_107811:325-927(-)